MTWQPTTLSELQELVDSDLAEADDDVIELWQAIRVQPVKWSCSPMGELGGWFWVIAKHEGTVLWYNDIEDGFNASPVLQEGVISDYGCEQHDLELCLRRIVATQQTATSPSHLGSGETPDCLRRPSSIVRRQTSYWTIQPSVGPSWRVHFTDKVEFFFAQSDISSVDVRSEHPLLADHCEPWQTLYFRGVPREPETLLVQAQESVSAITEGWRSLDQYLNRHAPLTGGYGALLSAPIAVSSNIARLLNEHGCQTSLLPFRPAPKDGDFKVCLFDRSYVIARDFRFALLPDGS